MRNIVPRAGIKPTYLAFQASVLPLHYVGSLMSQIYPYLPVYAAPCHRGQLTLLRLFVIKHKESDLIKMNFQDKLQVP